jgi:hypothetical protein
MSRYCQLLDKLSELEFKQNLGIISFEEKLLISEINYIKEIVEEQSKIQNNIINLN